MSRKCSWSNNFNVNWKSKKEAGGKGPSMPLAYPFGRTYHQEKEKLAGITAADVVMLKSIDLAKLALFEQGRDLSIDMLKNWLVTYKFKDWTIHLTTNPGTPVTNKEREQRAEDIADALSDHKRWRSHGRHLDIEKLKSLRIKIDDYSDNDELSSAIRGYNDPMTGFIDRNGIQFYLHNKNVQDY